MGETPKTTFDRDYEVLRRALVSGQVTKQVAKDWVLARGLLVTIEMEDENKKQWARRCDRDVPILECADCEDEDE